MPGKFVYQEDLTGETVSILGVNGDPMPYQTATIPITLKGTTVHETVAVAPADQLNAKVLLSTPTNNSITDQLLDGYLIKQQEKKENKYKVVQQVHKANLKQKQPVTYYQEQDDSYYEDDRASDLSYEPESETNSDTTDSQESDEEPLTKPNAPSAKYLNPPLPSSPIKTPSQTPKPNSEPYSSNPPIPNNLTEPTSSNPLTNNNPIEPYSSNPLTNYNPTEEPYSSDPLTHNNSIEPYSSNPLTINKPQEPHSSEKTCPGEQPFDIPNLLMINNEDNIQTLKSNTKADPTLKVVRGLAHHDKNGYTWDNGLLYHLTLDPTLGERKRLVVPKPQRQALVEIAHDRSGHFSVAKTRAILNNKFTWPKMATDISDHILACIKCKQFNKTAHKQAPYHTRPVISEPYQEITLDIIGPMPRSKQGYRFALTAICMVSRWPEVYPLKNTEAESVANALVEFLARNGIPSKILTDQGSQFMSTIMTQTCRILGITHIKTVPYRPQGNGILERFHGTLKPILAKATSNHIDWVAFLPLALSAVRAIPCRSTGFSLAELVFGRNTRNFLDVIYEGWSNPSYANIDVTTWVQQLKDKLDTLRDSALLTNHIVRDKQNSHKPMSKSTRTFTPGDLVFARIPGCRASLQASWERPFKVTKHIPPLNYEVQDLDQTWSKTTHINNLRKYTQLPQPEPATVQVACLVAEEPPELSKVIDKPPLLNNDLCEDFSQNQLDQLLHNNQDVFST